MGVYDPNGPPEGGIVIFEVLRVSDWMAANFEPIGAKAAMTFFEFVHKTHLYKEESEKWIRHYHGFIATDTFQGGMPGQAYMGWTPEDHRKKLYLGVYNRLCILRNDGIWSALTFEGRVEQAFRVVWATFMRCATVRAALYAGLSVPPEKPYLALDAAKKPHLVPIDRIGVTSFGKRDL